MNYAIINMEGRLTVDPEFRTGEHGEYCTFGLAVNKRLGAQENVSFYDCVANSTVAERIKKAKLSKGSLIAVVGDLTIREYNRKSDGVLCKSANVRVLEWFFTGFKKKEEDQKEGQGAQTPPAGTTAPAPAAEEVEVQDQDDLPL